MLAPAALGLSIAAPGGAVAARARSCAPKSARRCQQRWPLPETRRRGPARRAPAPVRTDQLRVLGTGQVAVDPLDCTQRGWPVIDKPLQLCAGLGFLITSPSLPPYCTQRPELCTTPRGSAPLALTLQPLDSYLARGCWGSVRRGRVSRRRTLRARQRARPRHRAAARQPPPAWRAARRAAFQGRLEAEAAVAVLAVWHQRARQVAQDRGLATRPHAQVAGCAGTATSHAPRRQPRLACAARDCSAPACAARFSKQTTPTLPAQPSHPQPSPQTPGRSPATRACRALARSSWQRRTVRSASTRLQRQEAAHRSSRASLRPR